QGGYLQHTRIPSDSYPCTVVRPYTCPAYIFMVAALHWLLIWCQLLTDHAGIMPDIETLLPVRIVLHGSTTKIVKPIQVLIQQHPHPQPGQHDSRITEIDMIDHV